MVLLVTFGNFPLFWLPFGSQLSGLSFLAGQQTDLLHFGRQLLLMGHEARSGDDGGHLARVGGLLV